MHIAVDGSPLLLEQKAGYSWYAHNLILALAKEKRCDITILCFTGAKSQADIRKRLEPYQKAGCKIELCTWMDSRLYQLVWPFLPLPYHLFFSVNPDITLFFNYTIPPGVKGKKYVYIYDCVCQDCSKTLSFKILLWMRLTLKQSIKRADHILTISKFSKRRILYHFPQLKKSDVTIIPCGVDMDLYRADRECLEKDDSEESYPEKQKKETKYLEEKYGIIQKYYLYLGTIEPRKNIETVICAYEILCEKYTDAPLLVLAGAKGWKSEQIYQKAKQSAHKDKIIFTGYVSPEDAPILMRHALAFLFLSSYEGFGMPPLEAMASKVPVIVSNCTSLPEVVGDAGVLAGSHNVKQIASAMERVYRDRCFRQEYANKGSERAKKYSWQRAAHSLTGTIKRKEYGQ